MKKCLYCGAELPEHRRKYCSWECTWRYLYQQKKAAREVEYRKCPVCGKEFKAELGKFYCSAECRNEVHHKRHNYKICPCCGKKFRVSVEHRLYCSKECRAKHVLEPLPYIEKRKTEAGEVVYRRICPVCGKEFETKYTLQKYCSKECQQSEECERNYRIKLKFLASLG